MRPLNHCPGATESSAKSQFTRQTRRDGPRRRITARRASRAMMPWIRALPRSIWPTSVGIYVLRYPPERPHLAPARGRAQPLLAAAVMRSARDDIAVEG